MRRKTREALDDEDCEPLLVMSKPEVDPYYSVRDHVQSQIDRLKARQEKCQQLLQTTNTAVDTEFQEMRSAFVKDVRALDKDLKGLINAVDMIANNRAKFSHIKDSEYNSRRKYVEDSQTIVNGFKGFFKTPAVMRKIEEDQRRKNPGTRDSYDEKSSLASQAYSENSSFIKNQKQQTVELIETQDKGLVLLGEAVDRVHEHAKAINSEVKEQNVMLDQLGNDVDQASSNLAVVQEALGKLLKTKDGCQIWTVVILTLILVLLIALIIWT